MEKPLLEKSGRIQWGYNVMLSYNFTGGFPFINGSIRIFPDRIEFKEILSLKRLETKDIDFVEVNHQNTFWFSHHGETIRFISFTALKKDRQDIIDVFKSMKIKVKEDNKINPFISLK